VRTTTNGSFQEVQFNEFPPAMMTAGRNHADPATTNTTAKANDALAKRLKLVPNKTWACLRQARNRRSELGALVAIVPLNRMDSAGVGATALAVRAGLCALAHGAPRHLKSESEKAIFL
jgi:hypothetical protein